MKTLTDFTPSVSPGFLGVQHKVKLEISEAQWLKFIIEKVSGELVASNASSSGEADSVQP